MTQLPLDLALPPRLGRQDFLRAGANAAALDRLEAWPAWPASVLVLAGPPGAGKSHLAAIWTERAEATVLTAADLAGPAWPTRLGAAVLLDDADRSGVPEAALFHLINAVGERGGHLLLTGRAPPDRWGVRTADLLSRLRLAPLLALGAPDDALMRAVLAKLFADRQIIVDDSVVSFLVLRLSRSLGDARAVVGALDREGLASHRAVTRPMAARVLAALGLDLDES